MIFEPVYFWENSWDSVHILKERKKKKSTFSTTTANHPYSLWLLSISFEMHLPYPSEICFIKRNNVNQTDKILILNHRIRQEKLKSLILIKTHKGSAICFCCTLIIWATFGKKCPLNQVLLRCWEEYCQYLEKVVNKDSSLLSFTEIVK